MAGLLDYLYDPSTFSGDGGLLSRLQGSALFNNPTPPQQQTPPIPVGGVQMPRIGGPDQYQPQQPQQAQQLPLGIANANAQMPQQQAPEPNPTFLSQTGNRFEAGLQNFVNAGGPLQAIGGLITGLASGNRTDPVGVQQQNMNAQFHAVRSALIANGVPERQASSTAMLSVLNPEAAKTVLPELLTNKEKFQTLDNGFGQKIPVFVNEREQTINGMPIAQYMKSGGQAEAGSLPGVLNSLAQGRSEGKTPAQLLPQVPEGYRDYVDALIKGTAVPQNMGRSVDRSIAIKLAHAVDGSFDETLIPTRIQMRKDFSGEGKNGLAIGALNTVQHHADQVSDAIENFVKVGGGSDYPLVNAGKLMLANNTGMDPKLRDAAESLKNKLNATEHEVASAYNSGHITDSDRKTWNEIKASNLPAGQLRQKLSDFVDLLNGKRDSLNHMYRNTFGTDAPAIDKAANDATTAKIHSRVQGYANEGTGAPSGSKPKTVIQNGHTYTLQSDGSYK